MSVDPQWMITRYFLRWMDISQFVFSPHPYSLPLRRICSFHHTVFIWDIHSDIAIRLSTLHEAGDFFHIRIEGRQLLCKATAWSEIGGCKKIYGVSALWLIRHTMIKMLINPLREKSVSNKLEISSLFLSQISGRKSIHARKCFTGDQWLRRKASRRTDDPGKIRIVQHRFRLWNIDQGIGRHHICRS